MTLAKVIAVYVICGIVGIIAALLWVHINRRELPPGASVGLALIGMLLGLVGALAVLVLK